MAKGKLKTFKLHDDVDIEWERQELKRRNREAVRNMRRNRQHERTDLELNWKAGQE